MLRCNLTSNAGIEDIISKAEDMLKSSDKALSGYTSHISEEENNISDLNREYLKTETEISFIKMKKKGLQYCMKRTAASKRFKPD